MLNDTIADNSSAPVNLVKRVHEDETMETDSSNGAGTTAGTSTNKKSCGQNCFRHITNSNKILPSVDHILNFPLPGSMGKVCHLKIYKDSETIKLNDLCEFVGFLSLDPLLSHESYHGEQFDNAMEVQTHNPPPSLVPRIHCVTWKKLKHSNPLVENIKFSQEKMKILKKELLVVLSQLLLGDQIAAEYLLYHLISTV